MRAIGICFRDVSNHNKHNLHLENNLCVTPPLSKHRACSYSLLQMCRRLEALSLACNVRTHHRWTPSELNPADAPTRQFEGPRLKQPKLYGLCSSLEWTSSSEDAVPWLRARAKQHESESKQKYELFTHALVQDVGRVQQRSKTTRR